MKPRKVQLGLFGSGEALRARLSQARRHMSPSPKPWACVVLGVDTAAPSGLEASQ